MSFGGMVFLAFRHFFLLAGAFIQLTAFGAASSARPVAAPSGSHDSEARPGAESSSRPESTQTAPERIRFLVDHYEKLNDPANRGKVSPEALTALIERTAAAYSKLKQKDPAVRGESSTPAEGFPEFQNASNNLFGALDQLGINNQINFQDPAQMQQMLAMLCLDQLGGLGANLSGLYGGSSGLGGAGGFGGAFGETGSGKQPSPGRNPNPDLKEAPKPAPGAGLWWKTNPYTGIYVAQELTSPVSIFGSDAASGFGSPATDPFGGGGTPPGPLPSPNVPNFPPGLNCPPIGNQGQQPQPPQGEPEEGEEGDGGGGTPGGEQPPQMPSGGGGAPPGGGGGSPQGAQIGRQGPFAPFVVGQIPPDLAIPFGQISRAVGSLLPPDFQDWVNRSAAEMLALVRPILFPGYKARGGPPVAFGLNGSPGGGPGSNGSSLLGVKGLQ